MLQSVAALVRWPGLGLAVPLDGPPDGVPLGHQHDGQRADARESGQHGDDPPGLISALPSSSYCLVTRAQSAARASISSTCHPILPGRAVRGPAVARRRRGPGPQRCLVRERGWATARQGPPGLAAGRPHRGAVTARSPSTRCAGGRPGAAHGLVLTPARRPTTLPLQPRTKDLRDDHRRRNVRGHGLVRKLSKVKRTEIGFVRLGRYPAGVLAVNGTNVNSGTLPLIESRTPWVPAEQFCGGSFRTWNRVTFAVRWSDGHLTKGLTLLSDPSEDYSTSICSTFSMTVEQRKAARDRLLQAVK